MLTPVIILNSSPATCCGEPILGVPMLILPGVALAEAMNSGRVFAGNDECIVMTIGKRTTPATGAMSRMKLKFRLS
jgi:hypothetical protein